MFILTTIPRRLRSSCTSSEDVNFELQNVLRAQLLKPGDLSALIETPGAFLLFVAKEKSSTELSVASFSLPKRSYDEWLAQQPEKKQ